jgi:Uma2 family endonuclease
MVIEVTSEGTASRDAIVKRKLYELNGVCEYWIVDPFNRLVAIHTLFNGYYQTQICAEEKDRITVCTLPNCNMSLADILGPAE